MYIVFKGKFGRKVYFSLSDYARKKHIYLSTLKCLQRWTIPRGREKKPKTNQQQNPQWPAAEAYQHLGKKSLKIIEVFKTLAHFSGYCEDKEESIQKIIVTEVNMGVECHHVLE